MPWGNVNKVPNCYKILLALMNRVIFSSFILLYLLTIASFLTIYSADASGTIYTSQTYGGEGDEYCHSIIQTTEGGYALVGSTTSFDADYYDFWLVKTDASGNHEWNQTYGGQTLEKAHSMIQTVDGGYAIAGNTDSLGIGGWDFLFVKTDQNGIIPEFPSTILLSLFTAVTLMAVLIHRIKRTSIPNIKAM